MTSKPMFFLRFRCSLIARANSLNYECHGFTCSHVLSISTERFITRGLLLFMTMKIIHNIPNNDTIIECLGICVILPFSDKVVIS